LFFPFNSSCREAKAYQPSEDVEERLRVLIEEAVDVKDSSWKDVQFNDLYTKFKVRD